MIGVARLGRGSRENVGTTTLEGNRSLLLENVDTGL
jgi:hypothetical protein